MYLNHIMKYSNELSIAEMITAYKRVGYEFCDHSNTLVYALTGYTMCVDKAHNDWTWAQRVLKERTYHRDVNKSLNSASI